ncbi:MAG: serine/threonine protein kinase [Sandaracinaceae bacterium]|nr:serine/threonine protein kinase [Sandaracinaceae bacterium]
MISSPLNDALVTLTTALSSQPDLDPMLRRHWREDPTEEDDLPKELRAAADLVSVELPALSVHPEADVALFTLFANHGGLVLLTWCSSSAWRGDTNMAGLLEAAAGDAALRQAVAGAARERVVSGPLLDALACVPLTGDGSDLDHPMNTEVRARLEILIWEAGSRALELPEFGAWVWRSPAAFEALIGKPAHGALRGRVLAARCLEVSVCAVTPNTSQELVGKTLSLLQPLLLHPEPLVWIHAARALGRLTGSMEELQGMLLDWVMGDSPVLRQRAITAFASLPADRLGFLASQLVAIVRSQDEDPFVLAAVAAATPYLYFERRDIWDRLAARVYHGDGGAITARALARGLATLWRRGTMDDEIEPHLRRLRTRARRVRAGEFSEMRRWIEVIAVTDIVDSAERDPLDLEIGLDNLMRLAAEYDDPEADARAARFASSISTTFEEARRTALEESRPRQRAAAINAIEACARAFALRIWSPLLATSPEAMPIQEPNLEDTWQTIAGTPAQILDVVKQRRQDDGVDMAVDVPLEVLAIRLGGYALDACGEDKFGPRAGQAAHDTCLWLRKLQGLADESRLMPASLETALSAIFWRLVDTARGTTLGVGDDVAWLGPFAAWWALVIDRPKMLERLATALPMMDRQALTHCCDQAEVLRTILSAGEEEGRWGADTTAALQALQAHDTELAHALGALSLALSRFGTVAGRTPELEALCEELVLAGDCVQAALADPVRALRVENVGADEAFSKDHAENAKRRATLVARAIRTRELSMLDVWLASLGPIASALLEAAVQAAIRRTPPPPPQKPKKEPHFIEGYELIQRIGEGGIGSVWLVRKPGADRMFVLKIPKREALQNASETESAGILASFVEEAAALAGLYHPNVANIIDRGVSEGVPFLVLEYLIGADLQQYSSARRMSLFELRDVVLGGCAGLAALHGAGLVHRDIKPANLWLRLPLQRGERFDPMKHRDPAIVPPLATVVIDFGMVRAQHVSSDVAGRFVAGTAGYIAPDQVLDPVELDPRADIYALAGTIYNVTTGRSFFDEIENTRDRIIAHMTRDPFEDPERLKVFPASMAKLLRAATATKPGDRPWPLEFGRAFAEAL